MAMLSEHLSEEEFLATQHRDLVEQQRREWEASATLRESAARFAADLFEPVRALLGPLHVTSGYRCAPLNHAVGGRPNSHHLLACAADVVPVSCSIEEGFARIRSAVEHGELQALDEAIIECGAWIHIQSSDGQAAPRRAILETSDGLHFARA
jgi:hypothetical protein